MSVTIKDSAYWLEQSDKIRRVFHENLSAEIVNQLHEGMTSYLRAIPDNDARKEALMRTHAILRASAEALEDMKA